MSLKTLAFSMIIVTLSDSTKIVKRSWDTSTWTDNCSLPPEPEHGSYEVTDSTESMFGERWPAKVVFSCWPGYTLHGANTAVCINGRWSEQIPRCLEILPQFTSQNTQSQHLLPQLEQITSQQQQNIPQQQQYISQQYQYIPHQQQYIPQQQQYQQQYIPHQQQYIQHQQHYIPQQQQPIAQPQQLLSKLERIILQQQELEPEEKKLLISLLQQCYTQLEQPLTQQQQPISQHQQCIPQQQQLKKQQQSLKKGVQLKKTSVRTGGCILPPYPERGSYKLTTVMSPVSSSHRLTTNLTYSCGYPRILEGPRSIICIDGRWSENFPYCRERRPEEVSTGGFGGGVGGVDAIESELPWHVGIYDKSNTPYDQVCGGTIIARNRVISAAHCFWDDLEKLRSASQFAVGAGKLYRKWDSQLDKNNEQKSDVSSIRIPPRYQHGATNFQEDIAMLTLTGTFTWNNFVKPAFLDFNPLSDARHLRDGNLAKVGGWGLITEDGMPATRLQVLQLPYVGIEKCITENEPDFLNYITADKICAGYRNGTALCMGDSGGGLVFSETRDGNQRFYLRGIVSTAPTNDNACNIYAWTTFTHVLRQEHFINQ